MASGKRRWLSYIQMIGVQLTCKKRNRLIGFITAVLLAIIPVGTASADMQGIDVSSWQAADSTCRVQADFAFVKVSQGTGYTNPIWVQQAECARSTGKALGLYHYAAGGDPVVEASVFAGKSAAYVGSAVLALDWEPGQNPAFGNGDWVRQFVNRVHALTGVWPLVYVSASYVGQIPSDVKANCGLWVAQYASMAATGYQARPWMYGEYGEAMFQYTSNGWINGYGSLDLDVFRGDRIAWAKYANPSSKTVAPPTYNPSPAPAPQPASNSCVVVRSGDTLSGIAARTGLQPWSAWKGYRSGNPNILSIGETVCYGGTQTNAPPAASGTYTVKSGDYLSRVWPTTWQTIAAINGLRSPYTIFPGQVLKTTGTAQAASGGSYTIRSGDTLSAIASRLGTTVSHLAQANGISNINRIYAGTVLRY